MVEFKVGGRPPIRGKSGTKGEWTIVPGDMGPIIFFLVPATNSRTGYPPDHMNAVLMHTIHFISLLIFYLGVRFSLRSFGLEEDLELVSHGLALPKAQKSGVGQGKLDSKMFQSNPCN